MGEKRTPVSSNLQEESESASSDSPAGDVEMPKTEVTERPGEMERQIHGIKWIFTVAAILSCVFLYALDTTVVGLT